MQLNAAGLLANTLAACALLGSARSASDDAHAARSASRARIAMAGPIGDDHLGHFFRAAFAKVGVQCIEPAPSGSATGTVIVLTTPDAQRSFLSYPGPPAPLQLSQTARGAIAAARCLVIEGYLWEMPGAAAAIAEAISVARSNGRSVAMTVSDVGVVQRFREHMLQAARSADILFTNAAEARALVGSERVASGAEQRPGRAGARSHAGMHDAEDAALQLGRTCPIAVVTDGSHGSYVTALGQLHSIPPRWSLDPPIDTCGAGDAYAAGFLHGYLTGMPVQAMGDFAAATASAVISHHGPQLLQHQAEVLSACWPVHAPAQRAQDASWSSGHAFSYQPSV